MLWKVWTQVNIRGNLLGMIQKLKLDIEETWEASSKSDDVARDKEDKELEEGFKEATSSITKPGVNLEEETNVRTICIQCDQVLSVKTNPNNTQAKQP